MNFLKPHIILIVAGIVVLFIMVSLAQEMNRRLQYQAEVDRLEQEVRQAEKGLTELEHLNQYFRTSEYQERLAREKLNYRAPGETVVLIPQNENIAPTETATQTEEATPVSIPQKWWFVFFGETT